MSSTQRSRAIAALASLVTLLAVAAVLSSVIGGNNGDTAATETSVTTAPSVAASPDLQVEAANVRSQGSPAPAAGQPGRSEATQTTLPPVTTAAPAGKKSRTAGVKPPVAAVQGGVGGATTPTTRAAAASIPKPATASPASAPSVAASVETSMTVGTVPSSPATTAKPTTTTTAQPTTTVATSSTTAATQPPPATGAMTGVELEIARMTNELRTNPNGPLARKKAAPSCVQVDGGGKVLAVPALTVSEAVSVNLSRTWSADMNSRNTMDHRSSASALAIYNQLGISPRTYGENVAWFQGYSDAQAAQVMFEGWRESDGHYCNMMSASFTSFGVGVHKGSSRTWGTQNFYATR